LSATVFWVPGERRRVFVAGSFEEFRRFSHDVLPFDMLDYLVATDVEGASEGGPKLTPFLSPEVEGVVYSFFQESVGAAFAVVVMGGLGDLDEVLAEWGDAALIVPVGVEEERHLDILALAERHQTMALLEPA